MKITPLFLYLTLFAIATQLSAQSPQIEVEAHMNLNQYDGQSTVFHGPAVGNAGKFESNGSGNGTSDFIYARAFLAGYNRHPFGLKNTGIYGNVTGEGASGWGVLASFGDNLETPERYVALGGELHCGIFMGGNVGVGIDNPDATLHIKDFIKLEPQSAAPACDNTIHTGRIYFSSSIQRIRVCVDLGGGSYGWTSVH